MAIAENNEIIQDSFINSTYFIMPVCFDNYDQLIKRFSEEKTAWVRNKLSLPYLLNYANKIAASENLFCQYKYLHPEELKPETKRQRLLKMVENSGNHEDIALMESFLGQFRIAEVLFSFFATGVGFVEFKVEYGDLPINCIIDFSYVFKNVRNKQKYTDTALDDLAKMICPEGIDISPFFYCADELKYECLCYHMIKLNQEEAEKNDINAVMYHFGRSYSSSFPLDEKSSNADNSKYDFRYSPP